MMSSWISSILPYQTEKTTDIPRRISSEKAEMERALRDSPGGRVGGPGWGDLACRQRTGPCEPDSPWSPPLCSPLSWTHSDFARKVPPTNSYFASRECPWSVLPIRQPGWLSPWPKGSPRRALWSPANSGGHLYLVCEKKCSRKRKTII